MRRMDFNIEILENSIPHEIKPLHRFLLWRYEQVKDRPTKVPYYGIGRKATKVSERAPAITLTQELSQLLDEHQAAAWLGVSVVFLRRGRSKGTTGRRTPTPRFIKLGGRVFYRQSDLRAWVDSLASREAI
jgi:predicted DNA-binding transcriptional regulator AlpA